LQQQFIEKLRHLDNDDNNVSGSSKQATTNAIRIEKVAKTTKERKK
jgi:hypothetical protein